MSDLDINKIIEIESESDSFIMLDEEYLEAYDEVEDDKIDE